MTSYPGEDPHDRGQGPEDPTRDAGARPEDGVEHTAPITPAGPSGSDGPAPTPRWGEQPQEQQAGGASPTPPYGQPSYGQPGYGQPPYGQVPSGHLAPYAPYSQAGYGYGAPGYPSPWAAPTAQRHPRVTTALVLGIVALGSLVFCGVALWLAPVAWVMGQGALRQIRESHGQLTGGGEARAAQVMGIIGTILLVIAVVVVALIVVLGLATGSSDLSTGGGTSA